MTSIWITKRTGKRGVRYLVRWIEPDSRINRGKTFRRFEDARDFKAKLKRDFENNEYFTPVRISYDEWVKRHLENLRNSPDIDLASKTIAGHKEALDHLKRMCRPKSPIEITPKMMRDFRRKLLKKGLAVRTINKHIATVRSALSYAVRAELVPTNKL
ncbi:MAG: site-specific integrase, partial [Planctomycetes bacterium]|nr:site-specific integrase [Planctomycetota bacterium]